MAKIIKLGSSALEDTVVETARILESGGVVIYPTDTLYGVGCRADNENSLERIFNVKGRPHHMPLPVMIAEKENLTLLAADVPGEAWKLIDAFWPGALTIILPALPNISRILLGGKSSIGIRMPDSELCREMARRAGYPVVTTSANRTGEPSVSAVDELPRIMVNAVDLILDGGKIGGGKPSSIVDTTGGRPLLRREGSLSFETIQEIIPDITRLS